MLPERPQSGLTMVEILVSSIVLMVIVGAAYGVLFTGTDTFSVGMAASSLEARAHQVVDRIAGIIADSGRDVLYPVPNPPYSSTILSYQENRGWADGSIQWGPPSTIELRQVPDDPDDGEDNNGNGLVDEGMIVLREQHAPGSERVVVLARWVREYLEGEVGNGKDDNGNGLVDERGLSFQHEDGVWTVRLTLERRDATGRLVTRTAETSVTPRN